MEAGARSGLHFAKTWGVDNRLGRAGVEPVTSQGTILVQGEVRPGAGRGPGLGCGRRGGDRDLPEALRCSAGGWKEGHLGLSFKSCLESWSKAPQGPQELTRLCSTWC